MTDAQSHPTDLASVFTVLVLSQFMVELFAPGDGGVWSGTLFRFNLGVDLFLFAHLYLFYRIGHRPVPDLTTTAAAGILAFSIYMAVAMTVAMENFGVFR